VYIIYVRVLGSRQGRTAASQCRACGEEEVKLWPCLTPAPEGAGGQRHALAFVPLRKKRHVTCSTSDWMGCWADVDGVGEEKISSAHRGSTPRTVHPVASL